MICTLSSVGIWLPHESVKKPRYLEKQETIVGKPHYLEKQETETISFLVEMQKHNSESLHREITKVICIKRTTEAKILSECL